MESVAWAPALWVLAAGLVVGAVLAYGLRGTRAITPAEEEAAARRRDLEAQRDTLLDQLRELDDLAGVRDPQILASERERLELLAARVLADLDRHTPAPRAPAKTAAAATDEPAAAPSPADAKRAARRGFAWGLGSAAAVAGLLVGVWGVAHPRGEGGSLTGELPMRGGPAPSGAPAPPEGGADAELAQLQAAVTANPEDLDARLELVQAYLGRNELMEVWKETQEVLRRSPGNPRAMSYQALVRLAMGQAGEAEKQLKEAMAKAPKLLEPRLHLSLVYVRTGRIAEANAVLDAAERDFPQRKAALQRLRGEIMATGAEEGTGEAQAADAPAAEAQAAPPSGQHVSGEIELDAGKAAPEGGIVFVTVRPMGQEGGPPVAVKRLPAAFPLRFTLGSEDSMMGQELPAELRVEARLDSDGDPLTRGAADLTARVDGVRLGQSGVRLRLR
jgi:cytochrome c-type biogenesis protein CcmH